MNFLSGDSIISWYFIHGTIFDGSLSCRAMDSMIEGDKEMGRLDDSQVWKSVLSFMMCGEKLSVFSVDFLSEEQHIRSPFSVAVGVLN
ncbi:MAG TPA: hypothetical protein DCS88_05285 [Alphaproteobacteria bacterium]|nr:hypothetical protein [Alphaproteobacteria bacterium]